MKKSLTTALVPFSVPEEVTGIRLVKIVPSAGEVPSIVLKSFLRYQCLAGFSLYFALSLSGTGARFCLAIAAEMISSWSSGGGT